MGGEEDEAETGVGQDPEEDHHHPDQHHTGRRWHCTNHMVDQTQGF